MDSRRNHIIMVNLWLSMLNISVMATTVLPAFFGMNLDNGLAGDDPRFFMLVRKAAEKSHREQQQGLDNIVPVCTSMCRLWTRALMPGTSLAVQVCSTDRGCVFGVCTAPTGPPG
jgi:hypothetical protein